MPNYEFARIFLYLTVNLKAVGTLKHQPENTNYCPVLSHFNKKKPEFLRKRKVLFTLEFAYLCLCVTTSP